MLLLLAAWTSGSENGAGIGALRRGRLGSGPFLVKHSDAFVIEEIRLILPGSRDRRKPCWRLRRHLQQSKAAADDETAKFKKRDSQLTVNYRDFTRRSYRINCSVAERAGRVQKKSENQFDPDLWQRHRIDRQVTMKHKVQLIKYYLN